VSGICTCLVFWYFTSCPLLYISSVWTTLQYNVLTRCIHCYWKGNRLSLYIISRSAVSTIAKHRTSSNHLTASQTGRVTPLTSSYSGPIPAIVKTSFSYRYTDVCSLLTAAICLWTTCMSYFSRKSSTTWRTYSFALPPVIFCSRAAIRLVRSNQTVIGQLGGVVECMSVTLLAELCWVWFWAVAANLTE